MELADWQKQHQANREFVDKLKAGRFTPNVNKGAVTLVVQAPLGGYGVVTEEDRPATREELEELGFVNGYVDAHPVKVSMVGQRPEGTDRGGYVPFVFGPDGAVALWDETDCEWQVGS